MEKGKKLLNFPKTKIYFWKEEISGSISIINYVWRYSVRFIASLIFSSCELSSQTCNFADRLKRIYLLSFCYYFQYLSFIFCPSNFFLFHLVDVIACKLFLLNILQCLQVPVLLLLVLLEHMSKLYIYISVSWATNPELFLFVSHVIL